MPLGYCLLVTLKSRLQALAPGRTPKAVLESQGAIEMLDVCFPSSDRRWLMMPRYTQPEPEQQVPPYRLKPSLPELIAESRCDAVV